MKQAYLTAIGAAALAVSLVQTAAAQTELPTRPDPAAPPTRSAPAPAPAAPAAQSYLAPRLGHDYYRVHSLILTAGWGAPYGWSAEYSYMLSHRVDLNAGLGLALGAKIGVGARYYLRPERQFSPYLGANLARTSGLMELELTNDQNQEVFRFKMKPSGVLQLRSGFRWQPGRLGLLGTLGYGARFTGDPVTFTYSSMGSPTPGTRQLVGFLTPGGLELSLSLAIGLGRY